MWIWIQMVKIKLVKLSENAKVPSFADGGSNGCDLYANIDKDIRLRSHRRILVKKGISIEKGSQIRRQCSEPKREKKNA